MKGIILFLEYYERKKSRCYTLLDVLHMLNAESEWILEGCRWVLSLLVLCLDKGCRILQITKNPASLIRAMEAYQDQLGAPLSRVLSASSHPPAVCYNYNYHC